MEKKILGKAILRCKLCGKVKELIIQSSKGEYKHDYSTLSNLGHKCEHLNTNTVWLGKLELLGIRFDSSVVDIDSTDDSIVSFNQPPLKIDWGKEDENA